MTVDVRSSCSCCRGEKETVGEKSRPRNASSDSLFESKQRKTLQQVELREILNRSKEGSGWVGSGQTPGSASSQQKGAGGKVGKVERVTVLLA